MNKKLLSIGETAKLLGVSIDTLRLWEKKNILYSFRPSPASKRYYKQEDIDNFLNRNPLNQKKEDLISLAKKWAFNESPIEIPSSLYCETSDIFSARLQKLGIELSNIEKLKDIFPLIVAIGGEIGNNSYNHNIGNWPDVPGSFFGYDIDSRQIVLADRGQGILKTLKRVIPTLKNDKEALYVAFTKYISGRAPENRGNGLKFVKDVIFTNSIDLQFYAGDSRIDFEKGAEELKIENTGESFHGCLAIIKF